jgi:DNA-binding NarL/FixJ family response regulator
MKTSNEIIRIAIADTAVIIRSGVAYTLRRLSNLRVQPIELASPEALNDCMRTNPPDVLFVNPTFNGIFDVARLKSQIKGLRVIALVSVLTDPHLLAKYDGTVSIFDEAEHIGAKILQIKQIESEPDNEQSEALSQREKEIVVCVVKGMTNKEIADQLFLSIHTIVTHRRNISRKLQIHSVAGLTIYAIVNKLVELSEIRSL